MGWILFEALGALGLLIFIVWWTLFHGRKAGELITQKKDQKPSERCLIEKLNSRFNRWRRDNK
jgi:hypothetical protein